MDRYGLAFLFEFEGYGLGYQFKANQPHAYLDFCSEDCAKHWFERQSEYGVIAYHNPVANQATWIADKPRTFRTKIIGGNPYSGNSGGNQVLDSPATKSSELPNSDIVRILGKQFEIQEPSIAPPPNWDVEMRGLSMQTMILKCPMAVTSRQGLGSCGHWLKLIAEFMPSAWLCPHCKGLIILDKQTRADAYPSSGIDVDFPNADLSLYCYSGDRIDLNEQNTLRWIESKVGNRGIFVADGFADESRFEAQFGANNVVLTDMYTEMSKVKSFFGHLME
jgi:hypothetical protein